MTSRKKIEARLNVRQLEAFRALMIAGTAKAAARLLGISQPAVSKLIELAEKNLKLTLFDRSRGRLTPTPEAGLLFEEVEKAFVAVDKIHEIASDIRSANTGTLTIAALPALGLGLIPRAVARFHNAHARTRISINIQTSAKIEEWVAAQQIDFGIAEFPFGRLGVDIEDFCRVEHVLAVPAAHPLAKQRVVRPADVADSPFISLTRSTVGRHMIDQIFIQAQVERNMLLEAQFTAVIASMIAQGIGIGFIDPFTAADFRDKGVVALRFEPKIEFHVGILHPTHRPMSRVAREFLAVLRACRNEVQKEIPFHLTKGI
ncbi:LysR substrate-binding domain-containing protein [Bradyrhizobium sp. 142]|uniref:LysR substrate-binding domain-containing protein n=1 Tax=Bradyrhizobium sp. 142 TaxID=2782618 RepID=UPI001FFC0C2E|nr:LysR substrate-binding domain-containing protein [Bradyrhizobium sp. 142]MCK1732322.1 LysR family transcriptional regulator [Bradyrhizobium sp. 142]